MLRQAGQLNHTEKEHGMQLKNLMEKNTALEENTNKQSIIYETNVYVHTLKSEPIQFKT